MTRTICAFILMMLGACVMVCWKLGMVSMTHVVPEFTPMMFNTALLFFMTGAAMAVPEKFMVAAHLTALWIMVIAVVTTYQDLLGKDFMIDNLLHVHEGVSGRMAPNTSLCFALLGGALWLPAKDIIRTRILSGIVGILGLLAFTGYAAGSEDLYQWSTLTAMALHTSIGFIVASIGLMFGRGK